jgi:CBS domain-containing protein
MLIANVLREKGNTVFSIAETATLGEAARELDRMRVGCVVVVDADADVVGMLSERDIVRQLGRRGADCLDDRVSSIMTRLVIWASPDETVQECLERMTDRRIRHLPVGSSARLRGIVSIGDLVKHKIREVEGEAEAMRAYIAAG